MSIWNNFASDYDRVARAELQEMRVELSSAVDIESFARLRTRVAQMEQKLDRLTLACAAMGRLLEMKGLVKEDEMDRMMLQLDLLDGREDGQIGDGAPTDAPRCDHCDHYVNPARAACVYCGRSLTASADGGPYRGGATEQAASVPQITCTGCGAKVPQMQSYFSDQGELLCAACNAG